MCSYDKLFDYPEFDNNKLPRLTGATKDSPCIGVQFKYAYGSGNNAPPGKSRYAMTLPQYVGLQHFGGTSHLTPNNIEIYGYNQEKRIFEISEKRLGELCGKTGLQTYRGVQNHSCRFNACWMFSVKKTNDTPMTASRFNTFLLSAQRYVQCIYIVLVYKLITAVCWVCRKPCRIAEQHAGQPASAHSQN